MFCQDITEAVHATRRTLQFPYTSSYMPYTRYPTPREDASEAVHAAGWTLRIPYTSSCSTLQTYPTHDTLRPARTLVRPCMQPGRTCGHELRRAALRLGQALAEDLAQEARAVLYVAAVDVAQACARWHAA